MVSDEVGAVVTVLGGNRENAGFLVVVIHHTVQIGYRVRDVEMTAVDRSAFDKYMLSV